VNYVPPSLVEWFGRVGGEVTIRYEAPGESPAFYTGKLKSVRPTGATCTLSGIEDGGQRRTIEFPLDRCTLLDKDSAVGRAR
jgi:hypothetical protein